jgi:hypothetical protein
MRPKSPKQHSKVQFLKEEALKIQSDSKTDLKNQNNLQKKNK